MPNYCPNCGESLGSSSTKKGGRRKTARRAYEDPDTKVARKVKRKPSAYNKRYAKAYKRLKKKHPRTSFAGLAKKAHRLARRKK
jgi:uncharacterized Zn finger protein (UPF0148 family)